MRCRGQLSFDLITAILVLILAFQSANVIFGDISLTQEKLSVRAQAKNIAQSTAYKISAFSALPSQDGFSGTADIGTDQIFSPSQNIKSCKIAFSNNAVSVSVELGSGTITESAKLSAENLVFPEREIVCGEKIALGAGEAGEPGEPTECALLDTGSTICNQAPVCSIICFFFGGCNEDSSLSLKWEYSGNCTAETISVSYLGNEDGTASWSDSGIPITGLAYQTTLGEIGLEEEGELEDAILGKTIVFDLEME